MERFDHASEIEACARRDVAALRRLYDREAGLLLAVAARIVRRREVAAEIVHDAFLDIWAKAGRFDRARGGGRSWMISLVRYRALKHVRSAGREGELDGAVADALVDEAPDPLAALTGSQEATRLHGCLSRLPAERRQVVLLAYMDGLSQSEIAARLGTPLGTIKAWTRRSLLALKECLS